MKNKDKNNIISFPSNISKLERQVEAILFAASEPLDVETIEQRVKTSSNLIKILQTIRNNYKNRGINLVCIKNKWSFRTAEDLSRLMSLQKSVQKKLSKATIETLAIIVYHQPVTMSEIEEIRGVSFATNTLETLLEHHKDNLKIISYDSLCNKPKETITELYDFLNIPFYKHKFKNFSQVDTNGVKPSIIRTNKIEKINYKDNIVIPKNIKEKYKKQIMLLNEYC